MKRRLIVLVLALGASLLPAATARAADPTPFACSGYEFLAGFRTAAGNVYHTEGNVCVYQSIANPGAYGTVARFKCYRNGAPWAGCRWTWNQAFQTSNTTATWTTRREADYCWTCGGAYVSDSGRFYGSAYNLDGLRPIFVRGASRSSDSTLDQVRFRLADGSTQLDPMRDQISATAHIL